MSPHKASNFRELNLPAVIERANEIIRSIAVMSLDNIDAKALAKAQMLKAMEESDQWESTAWHLVYLEYFERQIRVEDPQCLSNSKDENFYGGFVAS